MIPALDLIGTFPEPLLALDLEGRILRANAACAAVLCIKARELAHYSLFDLVTDPPEHLRACIRQWSGSSSFVPGSIHFRTETKADLPLLCEGARCAVNDAPVLLLRLQRRHEANRKFVELTRQIAALEAEVERRLLAEQKLLDADRRKDEFLAILAHELRNPLAPMMNSVNMLKLADDPASIMDQCNAVIERQARQLTRLVDDLLDVSRWARNMVELRREATSLTSIVCDAIATSEPHISGNGHTLELKLPPDDLSVYGDAARLVQALSNLLNNAAKYMPVPGKIGVSVEETAEEIIIRVTDTGIGIAEPMLERIFDLFVRADSSVERSSEGLGIGLTLTKQIVEAHGGKIKAFSAGKNRGSEFVMQLPKEGKKKSEQHAGKASESGTNASRMRVLVVDDNRDAADSMAAMLGILGNEVRAVYNGPDVPPAVENFRPQLVFLDIGMPGMSGYDVCRELRGAGHDAIRIVALTGYGQESDREQTREAGFDEHLVKPISLDSLQQALTAASRTMG